MTAVEVAPVAPVAPAEPRTPIKPSEALRLGRLIVPNETRDRMWRRTVTGQLESACALGAMVIGYGGGDGGDAWFDDQLHEIGICPTPEPGKVLCEREQELCNVVIHLNDVHGWNTAQMLTWLESLGR